VTTDVVVVGANDYIGTEIFRVTGGSVLFDGTTGSTPTYGAGTRLMWIGSKAALRAGMIDGTQWDDSLVGINSIALGEKVTASDEASVALGAGTTASNYAATATGEATTATKEAATAMGRGTTANGEVSTAMGEATTSSGYASLSEGISTSALGDVSHSGGFESVTFGRASFAYGTHDTASGNNSVSMGYKTIASGEAAVATGYNTTASGEYSHAEGGGTMASSEFTHAEGAATIASDVAAHAEGANTIASGSNSHAEGSATIASGDGSHAGGQNTVAQALLSTVIGRYNKIAGNLNSWVTTDTLFVLGNGISEITRNNAITILKNSSGNVGKRDYLTDPILSWNVTDSTTAIIGNVSVTDTVAMQHLTVTDSTTLPSVLYDLYHLTPTSDSLVVADDGFINLPAGVYGTLDVTSFNSGSWDAYAYAKINSDGSVFLVYNSTENVSTTGGTDNHMNIYDAGTYTRIENKLGGNRTIKYTFIH
jgi:hypothetical protein